MHPRQRGRNRPGRGLRRSWRCGICAGSIPAWRTDPSPGRSEVSRAGVRTGSAVLRRSRTGASCVDDPVADAGIRVCSRCGRRARDMWPVASPRERPPCAGAGCRYRKRGVEETISAAQEGIDGASGDSQARLAPSATRDRAVSSRATADATRRRNPALCGGHRLAAGAAPMTRRPRRCRSAARRRRVESPGRCR